MEKIEFHLRPMSEHDLGQIALWLGDFQDVAMFDRALPVPVSKENLATSWKSALDIGEPPRALWFFAETNNHQPLGMCGLQAISYIHGDAVVPVFVAKEHRGKGLAKILASLLIDTAFYQLRLNRLSTVYRADNDATQRVVSDLGFVEEGRVREGWFASGKHNDIVQVGLLKSEWDQMRSSVLDRLSELPFKVVDNTAADSH